MLTVKISITTRCNSRCKTCPIWKLQPQDMAYDDFVKIWDKLNSNPHINKIILNNTGELYLHPDYLKILKYIENNSKKYIVMTTNGSWFPYIPKIDNIIISFNGGTKDSYNRMTGLDFHKVFANIRNNFENMMRKISKIEIHCLICELNKNTEREFVRLWKRLPAKLRISYKYDNQFGADLTIDRYKESKRIFCDYLNILSISPTGQALMCAHDFSSSTSWGNILQDSVFDLMTHPLREKKRLEHSDSKFLGLCEKCNHNQCTDGLVFEACR